VTIQVTDESIGQRVKEIRRARKVSQAGLALAMGVMGYHWHQTVIAKIEAGTRSLKLTEAVLLAQVLNVPFQELLKT
jgi:transcriptional regulator with XRE-family HTH domain